jgi:hypothetical protein
MARYLSRCACALTGVLLAASAGAAENYEARAHAAVDAYIACAYSSADTHAKGTAKPPDVADAALGDCVGAFTEAQNWTRQWYRSLVSQKGQAKAVAKADVALQQLQQNTWQAVVSRVLKAREKS